MSYYKNQIVYAYTNELTLDLEKALYIGIQGKRVSEKFERMREHVGAADPQAEQFSEIKYIMLARIEDIYDCHAIEQLLIRKYRPQMNTRDNPDAVTVAVEYLAKEMNDVEKLLDWYITDNTGNSTYSLESFFSEAKRAAEYYHPNITSEEFMELPIEKATSMLEEHNGKIRLGFDRYYVRNWGAERERIVSYYSSENDGRTGMIQWGTRGRRRIDDKRTAYREDFDVTEVWVPRTIGELYRGEGKWNLEKGNLRGMSGEYLTMDEINTLKKKDNWLGYEYSVKAEFKIDSFDEETMKECEDAKRESISNCVITTICRGIYGVSSEFAMRMRLGIVAADSLGYLAQDHDCPRDAIYWLAMLKNFMRLNTFASRREYEKTIASWVEENADLDNVDMRPFECYIERISDKLIRRFGLLSMRDVAMNLFAYDELMKMESGEYIPEWIENIIAETSGGVWDLYSA